MVCWPCWRSMGANRKAAWSVVVVVALWLGGCDTAAEITAQSVALPTAISPAATPAPAAEGRAGTAHIHCYSRYACLGHACHTARHTNI